MGNTAIQWTEKTWNPVVGCTKVSEGCRNCYAMGMARRIAAAADARSAGHSPRQQAYQAVVRRDDAGIPLPQWNNKVVTIPEALVEPLRWRDPATIFVNSMSDLFHEAVPFEFVDRVFAVMALARWHTFQVLTKRPERMAEYLGRVAADGTAPVYDAMPGDAWMKRECRNDWAGKWPLPNVWMGASVENQPAADERIPHLLRCPAAVRFLSCEPLLGPVDLHLKPWTLPEDGRPVWERIAAATDEPRIEWVIAGGESGDRPRPCKEEWLRSLRDQCDAAKVAFFLKQLGAVFQRGDQAVKLQDRKGGNPAEWPKDLQVREMPGEGGVRAPLSLAQDMSFPIPTETTP